MYRTRCCQVQQGRNEDCRLARGKMSLEECYHTFYVSGWCEHHRHRRGEINFSSGTTRSGAHRCHLCQEINGSESLIERSVRPASSFSSLVAILKSRTPTFDTPVYPKDHCYPMRNALTKFCLRKQSRLWEVVALSQCRGRKRAWV